MSLPWRNFLCHLTSFSSFLFLAHFCILFFLMMLIYCLSIQLEERPRRTKIFYLGCYCTSYISNGNLPGYIPNSCYVDRMPFKPDVLPSVSIPTHFFSRSLDSSSTGQLSGIAWFIQSLHLTDFLISTYQNPTHSTDCGTSGSTISRDSHGVSKPILRASASCQGVRSTSHLPLELQRKAQLCFSGRRGGT